MLTIGVIDDVLVAGAAGAAGMAGVAGAEAWAACVTVRAGAGLDAAFATGLGFAFAAAVSRALETTG